VNQERAEPIENSFGVFVNRVDVRAVHSASKPAGLLRLVHWLRAKPTEPVRLLPTLTFDKAKEEAKNLRELHVDLADRDRLMKYPYLCL